MTVPWRRASAPPYCLPVCRSMITAWTDPIGVWVHGGVSWPIVRRACNTAGENCGTGVKPSGASGPTSHRTLPADMVRFLGAITQTPWGRTLRNGLAILGVDGDLATTGAGTPAAGRVQAKTGSRAGIAPNDQGIITALTMVGYADTAAGRQVAFAIFLRDLAFQSFDEFFAARNDQGAIAVAIQAAY